MTVSYRITQPNDLEKGYSAEKNDITKLIENEESLYDSTDFDNRTIIGSAGTIFVFQDKSK